MPVMGPRARAVTASTDAETDDEPHRACVNPYGVGIDVGSKSVAVCVLIHRRQMVSRFEHEFSTDWCDLTAARTWILDVLEKETERSERAEPEDDQLRYTLESNGAFHYPVILALRGRPTVLEGRSACPAPTCRDRTRAHRLARHSLSRPDQPVAPPGFHPVSLLLKRRSDLQREAARLEQRMNGLILRYGHTFGVTAMAADGWTGPLLRDLAAGRTPDRPGVSPFALPAEARSLLRHLLDDRGRVRVQLTRLERELETAADAIAYALGSGENISGVRLRALLRTVPGVDDRLATLWMVEVLDIRRFSGVKALAAWCGCDPPPRTGPAPRRPRSKPLRTELLRAAGRLIDRRGEALGQWGHALARRHRSGGRRKACLAVARRLAAGLYHVHRLGAAFDYASYRFSEDPPVPDLPVEEAFAARPASALRRAGFSTTRSVAEGWVRDLAARPGIGPATLRAVEAWIVAHRPPAPARGPSRHGGAPGRPVGPDSGIALCQPDGADGERATATGGRSERPPSSREMRHGPRPAQPRRCRGGRP